MRRHPSFCLVFLFSCFLPPALAMRLVVQRVKRASVTVDSSLVSSINNGVVALVGIHEDDTDEDLAYCARKLAACKLWANKDGKPWKHSVQAMNYDILCVSQFTLYGTVDNKKHSPDYKKSMKSAEAVVAYEKFKSLVAEIYDETKIQDGVFGAMMDVELVNDGPVTLIIDSPQKEAPLPPPLDDGEVEEFEAGK
mmetsp:Transcript_2900/g.5552  ORF Transcript_2900/g.5552 Transcript_2900/m.5552 type:complete len:195 (-) Transcript_2900:25-609(-)